MSSSPLPGFKSGLLLCGCSLAALAALSPSGALAFDCKLAKGVIEQAICANPAAKAADDAMSAAFAKAKQAADAKQGAALLANQRQWLASRNGSCADDKDRADCLRREDETRSSVLLARPLAGPGTPQALVPLVVAKAGTKKTYAVDLLLYRFPDPKSPAEKALNVAMDKLVSDAPTATDDDSGAMNYSYSGTAGIAYASDKLLSLAVQMFEFTGGAHGSDTNRNVTIDMASGRTLTFDDLIQKPKQGEVGKLCTVQIAQQMKQKLAEDGQDPDKNAEAAASLKDLVAGTADGIATVTAQFTNWAFHEHTATVEYSADEIAPHALGSFTCTLPYDQLRPLAKPDFPLPG